MAATRPTGQSYIRANPNGTGLGRHVTDRNPQFRQLPCRHVVGITAITGRASRPCTRLRAEDFGQDIITDML